MVLPKIPSPARKQTPRTGILAKKVRGKKGGPILAIKSIGMVEKRTRSGKD